VRASATIAVAGRTWSVRLRSEPTFDQQSGRRLGPWVLAGGIALSLVTFVVSIGRGRARERLRLQGRMLESMTEGVSVSDEHGTIVWTNPAEDRIFGWPPGGLIGRNVSEQNAYPPEESRRLVAGVIAELRTRGVWTGEFENVRADGTRFVTAARISALDVGGKPYWVCVQEDVTDRKRAEAERQALLAREHAAREQAETASRAKDDFLAMLGHELRNPLAPIVTVLHVLRMRDQGKTRELEIIERQVHHLIRLVDDLLDVSRITRGKIQLTMQPLALERIVAQAVEMASPLLEQRRHRLTVEVASDCVVDGDAHRLAQVVANLLTNAAKYTEPGGRVEVRAAREGDAVVLRVRDDGIGIAPALLPRVFDLFTQGRRAMDRSEGGLGIGLALVRSLVEAHGGRVEAESAGLGCGSEFVVHLPARRAGGAEAGAATAPAVTSSPGARRILLVDDNADAAESLAALLRAVGHEVVVAPDGPRALAAVRDWRPDVAVLDLGLPVMDGFELAGRLRAACAPRLIALTGYGQPRDKARARAAGFAVHLVKPVDPATLLAAIAGDEPAVRTGS
jgi:PAS domain S-box-containing protein